jgi:hypothetical protein
LVAHELKLAMDVRKAVRRAAWILLLLPIAMSAAGCSFPHAVHLSKDLAIRVREDSPTLIVSDFADFRIDDAPGKGYALTMRLTKKDSESFYAMSSSFIGKTADVQSGDKTLLSATIREPIRDGRMQFLFSDVAPLEDFLEMIGEKGLLKAAR